MQKYDKWSTYKKAADLQSVKLFNLVSTKQE